MSGKCALTVTGTRARYECFLRQLKAYGLVLAQILHDLLGGAVGAGGAAGTDVRQHLVQRIRDPATATAFHREPEQKCSSIHATIRATLLPYIVLMGLEARVDEPPEGFQYSAALWVFCSRLVFERPALVVQPDTLEGSHVAYFQEALQWFVAEQVQLKNTSTPTSK